jgi:hypothetical protein
MASPVNIPFDCTPLRAVSRRDVPWDASPDAQALWRRMLDAIQKHGRLNSYYLHDGRCEFHLTNHPTIGLLGFCFEGTILTDAQDGRAIAADLEVELQEQVCDWLTAPAVAWFREAVTRAVIAEFDRYIAQCDPAKTIQRLQQAQAEMVAQQGYVAMGL